MNAIVCLGYGLNSSGDLDVLLQERCRVAGELHKEKGGFIVNTGGDPRNRGKTEARAMTEYMRNELAIDERFILLEEEAYNTKTNALFTIKMLFKLRDATTGMTRKYFFGF